MKTSRILLIVLGCLLVIPGLGMLLGGTILGGAYLFGRDDDGYFTADLEPVTSDAAAVTAEEIDFEVDPGTPSWVLDALDADVRIRAISTTPDTDIFIGIAPERDVDRYLAGVSHDEVADVDGDELQFDRRPGATAASAPTGEDFWVASAAGTGTQQVDWEATDGRWAVVLMNDDGSPGIAADVEVAGKAGFLAPLTFILLGAGTVLTLASVLLIVLGARGATGTPPPPAAGDLITPAGTPNVPVATTGVATTPEHPVAVSARLDDQLSRWRWLVKWFLAIPHLIVLSFLWIAFAVLTVVAGIAVLFTGRYPRSIFDFNLGVLRWTWRVTYYATIGGIGTDRYPPFSLGAEPEYPATLDIAYPEHLSRGLVLVQWWLLALPHLVIVAVLAGSALPFPSGIAPFDYNGGLLAILVLIAGGAMLFTGRYPVALFDLIIGLNRWVFRVIAYTALMTDRYPPFRLDQGGSEPAPAEPSPTPGPSLDLRQPTPIG